MKSFDTKINSVKELSATLLNYCDVFSFVVREDIPVTSRIKNLLQDLSIYLIERKMVTEWPGTKLLLDTAEIFLFHFNSETALILSNYDDNLFNWRHPDLPEDLVCYKDGRSIFVSITHENDAYFLLSEQDQNYLVNKLGSW